MTKLLLAIAVLSTLLPLLGGRENGVSQVRFQLQSLLDLLGGTPLRDNSRGNGVSQVGTMAEPTKPPCGKSAVACPVGPPLICCKPGQDCDKGVCKCSKTGRCLSKCGKGACCVTADDSNGLCQCCSNTQDCDSSKGCQCGPDKCNKQCAKDPGAGATGCCQGTACTCCKKGQTCVGGKCSSVCTEDVDCDAGCRAENGFSGDIPEPATSTGCCESGNCECCDPDFLCWNRACIHE